MDRAGLNKRLLDELDNLGNVTFFWNHKLVGADFKNKKAWFEKRQPDASRYSKGEEIEITYDFLIGADGAHSAVRYHLMKFSRMNYTQEYIDTLWCEFRIEPKKTDHGDDFSIHPNRLHIWPAGGFMFIAIPSLDKSFTCTLFMPESKFKDLDANSWKLIPFFREHFPGVASDLISESDLRQQYTTNPHLPLISIKCTPYHYASAAVILGDAAHAMVPFYGQGMNAGLEDVRALYEHLDRNLGVEKAKTLSPAERERLRERGLSEYTNDRQADAAAINDLALRNYQEMRSDVRSPIYLFRKFVEERLYAYAPWLGWATQYSRVSFGNMRYSDVERLAQRQSNILVSSIGVGAGGLVVFAGLWFWRLNNGSNALKVSWRSMSELGSRLVDLRKNHV